MNGSYVWTQVQSGSVPRGKGDRMQSGTEEEWCEKREPRKLTLKETAFPTPRSLALNSLELQGRTFLLLKSSSL